jgi:hypothetical protein
MQIVGIKVRFIQTEAFKAFLFEVIIKSNELLFPLPKHFSPK